MIGDVDPAIMRPHVCDPSDHCSALRLALAQAISLTHPTPRRYGQPDAFKSPPSTP